MSEPTLDSLLREVEALRAAVAADAAVTWARWQGWIEGEGFANSAANFSRYLALRHHDIRPLQRRLASFGLSSLGRTESRVEPTLDALRDMLRAATGAAPHPQAAAARFFDGEADLAARCDALFGPLPPEGPVRLLVTLPAEAAGEPAFLHRLAELGVAAVRINCAHDDEAAWTAMIAHVDAAAGATGRRMKVFMDLAGPKIRTGELRRKGPKRVRAGEELAIAAPGRAGQVPKTLATLECTLSDAVHGAEIGHRVFIDDGRLGGRVLRYEPWGVVLKVETGPQDKGYKLKEGKGVNFPDTDIDTPALTDADRAALRFVARHADAVEFSFVQSAEDVASLQEALALERPRDWRRLGLVLKVETSRAVRNLPDMLVRAAGRQPTAVMIARGDLAVEIGFARLAEMQEELLWLCEAAHVPAIWATQVLESYLKTGVPSRGEMTEAAMAARAECVMLNKGPHLFEAIAEIDRLLGRMSGHMAKKTHLMRPLRSW